MFFFYFLSFSLFHEISHSAAMAHFAEQNHPITEKFQTIYGRTMLRKRIWKDQWYKDITYDRIILHLVWSFKSECNLKQVTTGNSRRIQYKRGLLCFCFVILLIFLYYGKWVLEFFLLSCRRSSCSVQIICWWTNYNSCL